MSCFILEINPSSLTVVIRLKLRLDDGGVGGAETKEFSRSSFAAWRGCSSLVLGVNCIHTEQHCNTEYVPQEK